MIHEPWTGDHRTSVNLCRLVDLNQMNSHDEPATPTLTLTPNAGAGAMPAILHLQMTGGHATMCP